MAIKPISVSQLNSYIKRILQTDPLLGNVSVSGEISGLKYHSSGHAYLSLKDENSRISCFINRDDLEKFRYQLDDGMKIIAAGYVSLFERGGSYSLNIKDIRIEGMGDLAIAFDRLKKKLADEGLFDEAHKKKIPTFPHKVAVITSESGAAVRDIIKIIENRNNITDVLVYPVLVQGPEAAADIARGIDEVNRLFPETDTIIVGRGGGSMEDLWAFNEEIVARSIFSSEIAVISAVGHETDFTIADFVADVRAETPTAAAQMAVPDIEQLREYLNSIKLQMSAGLNTYVKNSEMRLQYCKTNLDDLSPKAIMRRGYSAVLGEDKKLITGIDRLSEGSRLTLVMADGRAGVKVIDKRKE